MPGLFDDTHKIGGIVFDPTLDFDKQVREIAKVIIEKLSEERKKIIEN